MKYRISVENHSFEIEVGAVSEDIAEVTVDNIPYTVTFENLSAIDVHPSAASVHHAVPPVAAIKKPAAKKIDGAETIVAPIPGIILSISVNVGDSVHAGQAVAIMEAMKMENKLTSHVAGTVREIRAPKGTEVATGDVVMVIG